MGYEDEKNLHEEIGGLQESLKKAQAFKTWTHAYLDNKGVPVDPEPKHTAEHGCRISGRMDWVFNRISTLDQENAKLAEKCGRMNYYYKQITRWCLGVRESIGKGGLVINSDFLRFLLNQLEACVTNSQKASEDDYNDFTDCTYEGEGGQLEIFQDHSDDQMGISKVSVKIHPVTCDCRRCVIH